VSHSSADVALSPRAVTPAGQLGSGVDPIAVDAPTYRDALTDYDSAIKANPSLPEPYNDRALVFMALGEHQKAFQDYSAALSRRADYFEALLGRAQLNLTLGNYSESVADCSQLLALSSDDKHALKIRARAFRGLGQLENAVKDEEKSRALPDLPSETYYTANDGYSRISQGFMLKVEVMPPVAQKGRELVEAGKLEEALAFFEKEFRTNPSEPYLFIGRATAFVRLARWADATNDLDHAAELSHRPDVQQSIAGVRRWAGIYHGLRLLTDDKAVEALQIFDSMVSAGEISASLFTARGWCYLALSRWGDAARDIEAASNLPRDDDDERDLDSLREATQKARAESVRPSKSPRKKRQGR
jgi:tetratricopeptide (TPR) repeat protein